MALEASRKKNGPIYTYGPLIHNPQVLQILEGKGIEPLRQEDAERDVCPGEKGGTLIIRAHGVGPTERRKIRRPGSRS